MRNILKMTGVAVMMAGLAAAPSAAFAQSQKDQAASTGNNADAQDQRVDQKVLRSQERGKHHHKTQASIRNTPAPTANSSADSSTAYNTTSNVQPKKGDGTDASVHSKPAPAQVH